MKNQVDQNQEPLNLNLKDPKEWESQILGTLIQRLQKKKK